MGSCAHLSELRVINHGAVAAKLCSDSQKRGGGVRTGPQQKAQRQRQLLSDRHAPFLSAFSTFL
jgi:hypothetical protein